MRGRIRTNDVADEWRAQIDRCLKQRLTLRFLNSHEHIHLFPSLFELVKGLAAEYGISYVRFPDARITLGAGGADILRCATIRGFSMLNRRHLAMSSVRFLGAEYSGHLSQPRLAKILKGLKAGKIYELMCHPGYVDGSEGSSAAVRAYHRWEVELTCLTSPETRALCSENNVRLVGYRDLSGLVGHSEPAGRADVEIR